MNRQIYDDEAVLEILPQKLKKHRKESGLTIYDVAKVVGKVASSVSLWEKGKALPDVYTLLKLCKLYNLESIEQLLSPKDIDKNSLSKSEIELINLWRTADKKSKDAAKLILKAGQKK